MALPTTETRSWTRGMYLISTDPGLIDLGALNTAFETEQLPWAKALSQEELTVMLDRSVCFGLYTVPPSQPSPTTEAKREMIGLARLITDATTMAYLTDVYVLPSYQGQGLGIWLMECVKEWWDSMPNGRRMVLIAHEGKAEGFYAKILGTSRMEDEGKGYRLFTVKGAGALV